VGAVKIHAAVVEALRKKERGDETQFGSQLFRFVKFHSQLRIWGPIMPKLDVLGPLLPDFVGNFNSKVGEPL
jgi:hypothetical protein